MTRTMLSLMLIAAFGIMATLQKPILFKSSHLISGLQESSFMDVNEFAHTLETHYKQNLQEIPKNVYIFTVSLDDTMRPAQVVELVREMKSNKQIFSNSPKGFVTNYLRYNHTAEVSGSLMNSFKTLGVEYEHNSSNLSAFERKHNQRSSNSKFAAEVVAVPASEIQRLDRFLINAEKSLAEKSEGNYIIAIVFDQAAKPVSNKISLVEENISVRRLLEDTDTNTSNTTNGTALSITANTFTGISVGLFVAAVTIVALGLLSDIKTPGSFIAVPLHIGREH